MNRVCTTCLIKYSRGVIIGNTKGEIAIWKIGEASEHLKTLKCSEKTGVLSIAISTDEANLAVALEQNNIGTLPFGEAMLGNAEKLNLISHGPHYGKIDKIDSAVQKPLFASFSSEDGTLRIWNYHKKTCELAKKMYIVNEEKDWVGEGNREFLNEIAFHPSGYAIAVSFADKVRLFIVLINELMLYKTVAIENARVMSFSEGGHMLGISSQNEFYVYNTHTSQVSIHKSDHSDMITGIV